MSLAVDETAGDLPVRDVGLMRGGLMPTVPDTVRDTRSWKRPQVLKIKDRQRVFRIPRDQLEDRCLRLQEENNLLRQHTHTQEQRLRRMSTKLMRLRQGRPGTGPAGLREGDLEETIQELEARVATLESQKGALQSKLSMARQHIMDLGGRTHYRLSRGTPGRGMDGEGGVRRAAQTAPPRYGGPSLEDPRGEIERFRSSVMETHQVRVTELELAAQSLKDTLREKDREMEGTAREMRRQQADGHRLTIKDNVEAIRLQKQLSEKSAALRVTQERFDQLQEAYEAQLEERQRSLRESQASLLGKVEELSEQLKQERQRALGLEGRLGAATLSLQALDQCQERVSDLEGEKTLLKESYDTLLESTLSSHSHQERKEDTERDHEKERGREKEEIWRTDTQRLEEILRAEREERGRLEEEKEVLRRDKERAEEQREREREASVSVRENQERLEQEVLHYRDQVTSQQARLDSVTKEFDMSVEDLSETLLQIKTFRLQQHSRDSLRFLRAAGKEEDPSGELAELRASLSETLLELQKTRELLLLQNHISRDLQAELNTMMERSEREREDNRMRVAEKDKHLDKRVLQINTLRAQLKELAYSPRNRTIPLQYTWPGADQDLVQPIQDDTTFSQLRAGEALLEIHLRGATFTPGGIRVMAGEREESKGVVTFCTYALLDFEMHSTPLVTGNHPDYGFTSRYPLSARDLGRLGGQEGGLRVELHQALGGVRFVTRGRAQVPLVGAMERRGERVSGRVNVKGSNGDIIGVLDFWLHLFPPAEPMDTLRERGADRPMDRWTDATGRSPTQHTLGWQDGLQERELFDYGGGIPNELEVVLERCVGLSARWPPGLLPDTYLMYRLYDLPPHSSPAVPCSADPLFNDAARYPLAVTSDVLDYLRTGSLWVYVFNDSDGQTPPAYLAKSPVPLRPLATGKPIRGDYVLRDTGGSPRGAVRVLIRWRYPFQPPEGAYGRRETERETDREERRDERATETQRPIAKPRVKTRTEEVRGDKSAVIKETQVQSKPRPPPVQLRRPKDRQSERASNVSSPEPTGATPLQSPARKRATPQRKEQGRAAPSRPSARKQATSRHALARSARSSLSDDTTRDVPSLEQVSMEEDDDAKRAPVDSENPESSESGTSSHSDIVIIPRPSRPIRKGDKMRVEILSLSLGPSSPVALDQSVQRVYVEYRLLGVPMETTETPMSLRKPTEGETIHYNFSRVIYVDSSEAAPLRQYLYTMLEGTDPNKGRLRFTVVSEPMDEDEECVDVGHAFLDLQELLLTGNDIIEREIDIVSVDEETEILGKLKVSVEAAMVLTGIYREFQSTRKSDGETKRDEDAEDEEEERQDTSKKEDQIQVIDCDGDDSDF